MDKATSFRNRGRHFRIAGSVGALILLCAIFALSQKIGGLTWDETDHMVGISQQVELVTDWLHGNFSRGYRDLGGGT
jgi:hypothetical protein